MLPLGTQAPPFQLKNLNPAWPTQRVALTDFRGRQGLLVAFLSNHCPYVKHIADAFADLSHDAIESGIAVVGIMSNDVQKYPDDAPNKVTEECKARHYAFPYLYDDTQEVAHAYRAACTPDFYLFDRNLALFYRGQFDPSRPGSGTPVTGADLRAALDALRTGAPAPDPQLPSLGCNIKWKPGNEPSYFG